MSSKMAIPSFLFVRAITQIYNYNYEVIAPHVGYAPLTIKKCCGSKNMHPRFILAFVKFAREHLNWNPSVIDLNGNIINGDPIIGEEENETTPEHV